MGNKEYLPPQLIRGSGELRKHPQRGPMRSPGLDGLGSDVPNYMMGLLWIDFLLVVSKFINTTQRVIRRKFFRTHILAQIHTSKPVLAYEVAYLLAL